MGNGSHLDTGLFGYQIGDHPDPAGVIIEAGHQVDFIATHFLKFLLVFGTDLDDGFQAIRYKCRTENQKALCSFFSLLFNHLARIWLDPHLPAQAALKASGISLGG